MEFLYELGLFAAQTLLIVVAVVAIILVVAGAAGQKNKSPDEGYIEVKSINDRFDAYTAAIRDLSETDEASKLRAKHDKKSAKAKAKAEKARLKMLKDAAESIDIASERPRTFVLDFEGDVMASQVDALREEISAILPNVQEGDEVVLRLESPGGSARVWLSGESVITHQRRGRYACDRCGQSGGQWRIHDGCVGDRILAAPFAILGSIGVVAQLPNFHRLLKKNDVDFEQFTAGEYKRTVTMFGENTDKGRRKFENELEETHGLFKQFVATNRPAVDVDKVATGEVWYGSQALDEGLIDAVSTSDSYLQAQTGERDLYEVHYRRKQKFAERMGFAAELTVDRLITRVWQRLTESRYF